MNAAILLLTLALLAVSLHMMVRPAAWVGRGPIPAQAPANVRAMGVLFAILGGAMVLFFVVPILIPIFSLPE
jgi:hypothetical protein